VVPVEKSFAGSTAVENLTKSQISDSLVDMAKSNKIHPTEVVRFESSGEISDDLMSKVVAHRNGQ